MIGKIKLIGIAVALVGATGAFAYVQHLRSENATLTANAAVQDAAIVALQEENATRAEDQRRKEQQLKIRREQIAGLTKRSAQLSRELKDAVRDDPVVVQCLAVKPGREYVNRLRKHSQGAAGDEAGEALSGPGVLRVADSRWPHG